MLFVHATTSAILPLLKVTGYQLVNLQELLFIHGVAPMSGEIFNGGILGICDKVTTAFANIDSSYWKYADLVKNYAGMQWKPKIKNSDELLAFLQQELFQTEADTRFLPTSEYLDSGIVTTLVNCLRHLQMSALPRLADDDIADIESRLDQKLTATIFQLQMNYVVARFFFRIRAETGYGYKEMEEGYQLFSELSRKLPLDFLERCDSEQYDVLNGAIKKLEGETLTIFKKYFTLQTGLPQKKKIELCRALRDSINKPENRMYIGEVLEYYNHINHQTRTNLFEDPSDRCVDTDYARGQIQESIRLLSQACTLLIRALRHECSYKMSAVEFESVKMPFPIIFATDCEDDLEPKKHEHRAKRTLKLGTDIRLVATDDAHRELLKQYMSEHESLTAMQVVSIDELKSIRQVDRPTAGMNI